MKSWVLLFLLLSVCVTAEDVVRSGSITLLALMESSSNKSGTVATLSLELRPGSERVFLETFPMTKVTTQASLRFAQQIACKSVDVDCSQFDFLYTIKSLPGIVGGPSAGGAAALLTAALLLNKEVPDEIAMTGTINSGGLIGPVGGLRYKVEAASNNGIKQVLLPQGTKDVKEEDNSTIDLVEFGKGLNLSVIEVSTLDEVLELALGIPQKILNGSLNIEGRYKQIMGDVANDLCGRNKELSSVPLVANLSVMKNFTERAQIQLEQEAFYSAASYCFRANVEYKRAWYVEKNFSKSELESKIKQLKAEINSTKVSVESRSVSTLTDLQTFMAVMERLDEASDLLSGVSEELNSNSSSDGANVGFAEERLFSAITWSRFFNGQDKAIVIDNSALKDACASKISEAEERYNYVKSVIPEALEATRKDIDLANSNLQNDKFIMCLYGASKAKSEADVLLSLMGVEEERFDEVIDLKLNIARQALMRAQLKNIFPIIAYSYYEYASSLRDFDRVSALLFTEYSLELSNFDIYFEEKRPSVKPVFKLPSKPIFAFLIGLAVGGFFVWFVLFRRNNSVSRSSKFQTLQAPRERRLRGKKR